MFLSVLKYGSGIVSHCAILSKKDSIGLITFVQFIPYLPTNRIKYVLYDGIHF
jgi:hypothetical protein